MKFLIIHLDTARAGLSMAIKIGSDIIEISRFSKLQDQKIIYRCFTEGERNYCFSKPNPPQHLAARFAAKEAVIKALSGFELSLDFNKIEICNEENGRPYVQYLTDDPCYQSLYTDISISHSGVSAVAFVLISDQNMANK